MGKTKLTAKEAAFIDQYIKVCNGALAARRAGYPAQSSRNIASLLLAKPNIRDAVEQRRKELREIFQVDRMRIVQELAAIAFSSPKRYSEWDSEKLNLHPSEDLTETDASAVKKLKRVATEHGVNVELELHGKVESLALLAKILGIIDGKSDDGPDDPSIDEGSIRGAISGLKR